MELILGITVLQVCPPLRLWSTQEIQFLYMIKDLCFCQAIQFSIFLRNSAIYAVIWGFDMCLIAAQPLLLQYALMCSPLSQDSAAHFNRKSI